MSITRMTPVESLSQAERTFLETCRFPHWPVIGSSSSLEYVLLLKPADRLAICRYAVTRGWYPDVLTAARQLHRLVRAESRPRCEAEVRALLHRRGLRRWQYIRARFPPGPCAYCGSPDAPALDHVVPRSRGGGWWDWANLVRACHRCNSSKGKRTPGEWEVWRLARGMSWPPAWPAA